MKKFDLTSVYNETRPLSWSAISSFEWNPKQWYSRYVLKEEQDMTPELIFGSYVDKRIQSDPAFLPKLERYPVMQNKLRTIYKGIPLIGIEDHFDPNPFRIKDDKTGRKKWDKKRADETGQLTMYVGMHYLQDKIKPEKFELEIDWLPTHYVNKEIAFIEPDHTKLMPHTFRTKRTMLQVLTFFQRIEDTWDKMQEYAERQARLNPEDMSDW